MRLPPFANKKNITERRCCGLLANIHDSAIGSGMKSIGKYEILGLLGRGGMGKIFKVRLPVIGRIAALKLLAPNPFLVDILGMGRIESLFISEAVTMAGLRHPHLLGIWDFDQADGRYFYTMDYYSNNLGAMMGESSRIELPSRIIPTDRAIHYVRQTLEGLACLHHAGIVHRDIKPFNILITDQDTVKIGDFGLSKLRGEPTHSPRNLKIGSPFYAPPEQERDPDHVDFSADLYAVAVMLYRMLTGCLSKTLPAPVSRTNPDLDENWDQFLFKAISPKPRDRFSSAGQMLDALTILEADWVTRKERTCALVDNRRAEPSAKSGPDCLRPRKEPIRIRPGEARAFFDLDDLWRPRQYIAHRFHGLDGHEVLDESTGLIWQQAGSPYPLPWKQAKAYVRNLNGAQSNTFSSWRLPTVDELMSIVTRPSQGLDLCMEPVFDPSQKWLWSADKRSFTAAWYLSMDLGFVSWQDKTGYYYVKGVRG
jgi:serine/threonine protein kinase